jgi:lipoprotein-releasing system permease protein
MFELSVAFKYLIPRRRQLSVSIIALVSVLVISLVVWLVCTFLSVTQGIERRWIETLTALNAPITITPTQAYYDSYYYQVDGFSGESDFALKTIGEKRQALTSDLYDPEFDPALPANFPQPDLDPSGNLRDPVQGVFSALERIDGVQAKEFETALASLRLRLIREETASPLGPRAYVQSFLNQVSYLGSFDGSNPYLAKTLKEPTSQDLSHLLQMMALSGQNSQQEAPEQDRYLFEEEFQERLQAFFGQVSVSHLVTQPYGWVIPPQAYPESGQLTAYGIEQSGRLGQIRLYTGSHTPEPGEIPGQLSFDALGFTFTSDQGKELPAAPLCNLVLEGETLIPAQLDPASLKGAREAADLRFQVALSLQGAAFAGSVPYTHLKIGQAEVQEQGQPLWLHKEENRFVLPRDEEAGYGILLSHTYRDHDVRIGDRGYLGYYASSPSSMQEQRIPVYVAGFYDPGLTPAGGKLVLVDPEVTSDVRAAISQADQQMGNGIHVWFDDVYRADEVKAQILDSLEDAGIAPYWQVETFREYEFARPLMEQFQSDRVLFSAIALIIILVACSNIISMLILLVNDKRREIGILRAMGATSRSITLIFATCGTFLGILGSTVGIASAIFTLRHLDLVIAFLSALQGHEAFHSVFYGGELPNSLSMGVLAFVVGATVIISVAAGVIPALKAARIRPAAILRSE